MIKGELEIHFGDEFTHVFKGKSKKYVILDLGEENWFEAAVIMSVAKQEALGLPGTSSREDISKIIGSWDLDRIIRALDNNFGVSESLLRLLRENSSKTPRKIS